MFTKKIKETVKTKPYVKDLIISGVSFAVCIALSAVSIKAAKK